MSPTAAGEPPTSPLADLIGARREELLRRWTQRVAERYAPGPLTRVELADHLPEFLDTLEASLRAQVTHPNERASMAEQTRVGALHGQQRYRLGFDIEAVIREYGALREILFDLLEEAGIALSIGQTRVLLEAITVAISEAVTHYAQERDKVLRQSEARFRSLVLAGSRIVWTTDVRGQATEDSPSWRAFTGQTQEEYLAEDGWLSAIHPDDRERSRAAWRQAVATRQPYAIEHRVRRHDGAYRDMAARAVPVASEPREVPEWVGTHVDLTEQKQAERALRESEDRQRLALGSAEMGTFDNDLVAGIMAWDERSKALFGVNPEDVPTLDLLLSRVHPDDRPTLVGALHRAIQPRSGGLYEAEYRIRGLTEGRERWVAVRGRVHFDARNEPVRLIGTVQDITRPKGVEAALRETSERLRAVLDTAVDGIITIDERGIIQTVNAATVQLFQYAPEELIGQNVKVLMPEPYRREHDSYMARYRDTGVPRVIGIGREVLGQRKDGSVFPLELAVAESKWQGGRIFTGMVRDITQRKQAEHTRDFLLEVGRALAESLDVANVLEALTSLVVSRVADYCIVDLLGEDGRLHRSKVAARDPAMLEVLRQTSPYAPRLGTGSPLARSFETGEPFLVPDITPAWLDATAVDAEHRGLLERLAPRGAVFVPLLARGRKLGIFNLVWRTPNQATPETMEVARAVA
ncbi:MAG TPA: PAS domain S-box protein, partial [Myxococcaceae bacterium]|nr:PAS domain S-box protein [Myxococcaceae bacterium]